MTTEIKTTASPTLAALFNKAAAYAFEVAAGIKIENGEAARALAMVLADNPNAEFHVSVMIAPTKTVAVSVVTAGQQFVIHHADVLDDEGLRH